MIYLLLVDSVIDHIEDIVQSLQQIAAIKVYISFYCSNIIAVFNQNVCCEQEEGFVLVHVAS